MKARGLFLAGSQHKQARHEKEKAGAQWVQRDAKGLQADLAILRLAGVRHDTEQPEHAAEETRG
ncbi:MAG: hypothetical protein HBSAPP03_22420 [Phycisphaerae bacterium]|nr:MAG: hypothetical protein HBSAPP03_22420 [Phycisphaerae bacterium]